MENHISLHKLHETIKKVNSSDESLDANTDLILKASSELDELIRMQIEQSDSLKKAE